MFCLLSCYEGAYMIKIYTDAASNLFPSILKEKSLDIKVISMNLHIDDKDIHCYDDDINVDEMSHEFYIDLENKNKKISTSLINPDTFMRAFKNDIEEGNNIICFTMASGISGTYQAATIAADEMNEEAGKKVIHVINSATASLGEGLQAIRAYNLAKDGMSFEALCEECDRFVLKVRSEFTVGDVSYLISSGRVSKTLARIAKLLNLKVMLYGSSESKIEFAGKVHGRKLAISTLAKTCSKHIVDKSQTVYIAHCDALDDANKLKEHLEKEGINNVEIYYYDLITGSHVGRGTVALFYVGENRDL